MSVVAGASAVTALQRLEAFETPEHRAQYPELYEDEHLLEEGRLSSDELFWRDHYSWLKDQGYLLRPRYSPDWSAPWLENNKIPTTFEDSVTPPSTLLIDATRIADGSYIESQEGSTTDEDSEEEPLP
ncbi:hypothetical protein C8R46DRAFT_1222299 [Mycena filopes]|nr:hypothetical protein C8R46DRAFT_1222299 [Mycena filopes]